MGVLDFFLDFLWIFLDFSGFLGGELVRVNLVVHG